jgi:hypothetical protein
MPAQGAGNGRDSSEFKRFNNAIHDYRKVGKDSEDGVVPAVCPLFEWEDCELSLALGRFREPQQGPNH